MQIDETSIQQGTTALWWILMAVVVVAAVLAVFFWLKGRRLPGEHVFRASRFSRGNLLFPTQVVVSPGSVLHYKPEVFGGREQSIHIAHISSVLIDRNLFFSDVMIETSGGHNPVRCHGHRKRDAVAIKGLVERFQTDYYARPNRRRDPLDAGSEPVAETEQIDGDARSLPGGRPGGPRAS